MAYALIMEVYLLVCAFRPSDKASFAYSCTHGRNEHTNQYARPLHGQDPLVASVSSLYPFSNSVQWGGLITALNIKRGQL